MRKLILTAVMMLSLCASARAQLPILPNEGRDIIDPAIQNGIQAFLMNKRFDAWIFSGVGSFGEPEREFLGLRGETRHRWFIIFCGMATIRKPLLIFHPDDEKVFAGLKLYPMPYRTLAELQEHFKVYVYNVARRIALNQSPHFNIPDVDFAGAGLKEWLEECGFEVISAGSMLSFFNTRWLSTHIETHAVAAAGVDSVMKLSLGWLSERIGKGKKTTDYDLMREVEKQLKKQDLEPAGPLVVCLDSLTLDGRYEPQKKDRRVIERGDLMYLEISARQRKTEYAMHARLGWTVCIDTSAAEWFSSDWGKVAAAADAALEYLSSRISTKQMVLGFQVDDAAREKIGKDQSLMPKPLGWNLNAWNHRFGVRFDNCLAHDEREIIPGMGFTLEPAVYRERYAVRMCNDLVIDGERNVTLSAPLQRKVIALLGGPRAIAEAFEAQEN